MIRTEHDRIADALTHGIAATFAATILAVPWFGLTPALSACAGLVIACVAFKAVTEGFGK